MIDDSRLAEDQVCPQCKLAEDFLFGKGETINQYYIETSPFGDMICYICPSGQEFDLLIEDTELEATAIKKLKELGVRIIKLG